MEVVGCVEVVNCWMVVFGANSERTVVERNNMENSSFVFKADSNLAFRQQKTLTMS